MQYKLVLFLFPIFEPQIWVTVQRTFGIGLYNSSQFYQTATLCKKIMEQFCGSQFWVSNQNPSFNNNKPQFINFLFKNQDWNLTWYTENPDFTPCFERTVISNIPCLFLLVFSFADIYLSYHSKSRSIPWSPLNCAKIIVALILVLLEVMTILVTRVILPTWLPWYQPYSVDLYIPVIRAITLVN